MSSFLILTGDHLVASHQAPTGRFRPKRFTEVLIHIVIVAHSWAGKTDQLPAHHVDVAAMHRIAEHALDGVLPQERKKQSGFDLLQLLVLPGGSQLIKTLQVS